VKVRYDTYCGLNCGACHVGLANEMNDEEALKKLAQEWGVSREDVNCTGCKTGTTAPFCAGCEMRVCAMERGHEFCYQCKDYPCPTISDFRNDRAPHHSAVFSNLSQIEKHGIETWLKMEEARWSCQKCGKRYAWYNDNCTECGEELYSCEKEEKELD